MPKLKNLDVLHCTNGNHEWTRLKQKGRKPFNCPKHPKPETPKAKPIDTPKAATEPPKAKKAPLSAMQEGTAKRIAEDRKVKIAEILKSPNRESCECPIHPEITNEELYWMKGCREAFACPTLVRVRNAVGLHDGSVDTEVFWKNRYGGKS